MENFPQFQIFSPRKHQAKALDYLGIKINIAKSAGLSIKHEVICTITTDLEPVDTFLATQLPQCGTCTSVNKIRTYEQIT